MNKICAALLPFIMSASLIADDTFNSQNIKEVENQEDSGQSPIMLYGHLGVFGKSSVLGKIKDSYMTAHFAANLAYNFYNKGETSATAVIGIWGATSLLGGALRHNAHEYIGNHLGDEVGNDWNNNNSYLEFRHKSFSIMAGRFDAEVDWVGEHMQGVHIEYDYGFGELYATWINEYAHSSREETSNFVEFKELYYGANEFVVGSRFGTQENQFGDIYAYHLTDFFTVGGVKLDAQIPFGEFYSLRLLAHGNYLHSYRQGWALGSVNENRKLGHTYLATAQPSISYKGFNLGWVLGAGYTRTGNNDYLQAHMGGNMYVFEAEDDTPFMFNVIAPGGWHNGTHQTSMFQANTDSYYAFWALRYKRVAFNLTARHSLGKEQRELGGEQLQVALGFGWNIYGGLTLGAVGVYMEQKRRDNTEEFLAGIEGAGEVKPINTSYAKAFLEYRF